MKYKMRFKTDFLHMQFIFLFISMSAILAYCANADAGEKIRCSIRVIHATSDATYIDSGLRDLASQLQSVFKYTSYRLLDSHKMEIENNTTGAVSLPGGRILQIAHSGMSGDRIKFTIHILKNSSQVFTTQVLLKNGNSVTIGGPDYSNGYLLFNISGRSN